MDELPVWLVLSTSLGDPGKIKIAKNAIIFAVIGLVITMLAFAITNFILGAVGGTNSSTSGGSSSSSSSPSNAGESGGDSGNGDSSTKTVEVEGVDVKAISDITVGFTRKAEASVIPDYATDRTITWSSSNPAVATVSGDGTVKGISEGTATITATANNGKSNSVKVKIIKPILIKTIKLNRSDFELEKDRYAAIVATIDPTYATNKTIVWSSSDASIVSVDQNGRVHAIKNGDAIITATAKDGGGAKASVKVSVGLVEQLITEAKNVTNYIYVNGYTYGDAAHNPAMDHPADKGQRHQRDQCQPGVDGEQDGRRHDDHQHVGDEVERMQRQEDVDAVGLRPDARHQVARALAAKVVERQAQQVFVRGGAQVGTDALGHQRKDVGARPAQAPGQQRRQQQPAQVEQHQHRVDLLAVLERDQDVVHQRDGEVGRNQRCGRGRQRERETGRQLLAVGPGKPPQAQQHPRGGLGRLRTCAGGAFVGVGRQGRVAGGAGGLFGLVVGAALAPRNLLLKPLHQAQGLRMVGQREAPQGQPLVGGMQFERTHAPVVVQAQSQVVAQGPTAPGRSARVAGQQPPGRHHHPARRKPQ